MPHSPTAPYESKATRYNAILRSTRAVRPTKVKLSEIIAPCPNPARTRAIQSCGDPTSNADAMLPKIARTRPSPSALRQLNGARGSASKIVEIATPSISIPARLTASGSLRFKWVTNPCTSAGCTMNESTPSVPNAIALKMAAVLFTSDLVVMMDPVLPISLIDAMGPCRLAGEDNPHAI